MYASPRFASARRLAAGTLLAAVFVSAPVRAELPRLWVAGDGDRIPADALDYPSRDLNPFWDGRMIRITACRNETVAVQVVVAAEFSAVTVTGVEVRFAAPPFNRIAEVFSEHYLNVVKPSPDDEHGGWFWYKAAAPNLTGWLPDALVPLTARAGRGGLPIRIEYGRQQAFWIDLAIPNDPAFPAGLLRATVRVQTNEGLVHLPLQLEVVDAALPDTDLVKTMIYLSDVERRHGITDPAIRRAYRLMAHRHRFDTAEGVGLAELPAYAPYLTGDAFTRAAGYDGPGQGQGLRVFGVGFYGAVGKQTKAELWKEFDAYAEWFKAHAPKVLSFIYLTDEPRKDMWAWVKEKGDWIHENPGPGGKLPVFVTMKPRPEVEGAVDIFDTVADALNIDGVKAERAKGRRWWFYNGMRPMSGAVTIDAPGVDFRVQPWICWLNGVECWFYWESTHWQHNHQGPRAGKDQNVWVDPVTFAGGDAEVNGDGTLFYPGQDAIFKDQDRGIPGPVSSIRMKNLRRGQQDLAYVALAIANGHERQARAIGKKLIPRAFSDAKPGEPASWPVDGTAWERARQQLIDLIKLGSPRRDQD